MKRHKPSRTAQYMAYFRALESARPAAQRLFYDPFAPEFLGPMFRTATAIARVPAFAPLVCAYTDLRLPGARTSAIARTRLIDDTLLAAVHAGITQVVILGAGFDCRAYRMPQLAAATVFEVDHPATHATKLARLRNVLPKLPGNVRHVPIDFMHESLPDVLGRAGFAMPQPAFFIWEGVTQYLTPAAVDAVLNFVARCSPGSRLVFTYIHAALLDGSISFKAAGRLLRRFAKLGEPWIFALDPEKLPEFLQQRGLQLHRDLAAREYRALCYQPTSRGLSGYEFYHVVEAQVRLGSAVGEKGGVRRT